MQQILLQNATAVLLQNATKVYYKMPHVFYYKMRLFYYKMRQLLQIATILLQNATFLTNCNSTDTYCTTFYWICISGRPFLFLIQIKNLSDTCFGSIQYRSDMLKKLAKNANSVNSHLW